MPTFSLASLEIKPYGLEVFTDLQRKKEFTTLFYRRKNTRLESALGFVSEVLADVAKAGLLVTEAVKIQLTTRPDEFRCHLEVTVKEAS